MGDTSMRESLRFYIHEMDALGWVSGGLFWVDSSGWRNGLEVFALQIWCNGNSTCSLAVLRIPAHCSSFIPLQERFVHSRSMARSCPLRPWCSTRHQERAGSVPRAPSTVSCRRSTRSSSRPTTVARGPGRQPGRSHTSESPDTAPGPPPTLAHHLCHTLLYRHVYPVAIPWCSSLHSRWPVPRPLQAPVLATFYT